MKRYVYIAFILAIYCGDSVSLKGADKIKTAVIKAAEKINTTVSVYYGSLGTRSVRFMIEQFYPAYLVHGEEIIIELIPFGRGELRNSTGIVNCQYGAQECYGNKVQACVIDAYPIAVSTEFVVCAMKSGDASLTENLQECAEDNNITWSVVEHCLSSRKGDRLLFQNGLRTISVRPKINFIPTVIFNHVYDEVLQKLSLGDFQEIVEFLVNESDCTTCRRKAGTSCNYRDIYSLISVNALCVLMLTMVS